MATKEEIREGIAEWLWGNTCKATVRDWVDSWTDLPEDRKQDYRQNADKLLTYEDSLGLVLKVEKELPNTMKFVPEGIGDIDKGASFGYTAAKNDMLKAGFTAVEPLV